MRFFTRHRFILTLLVLGVATACAAWALSIRAAPSARQAEVVLLVDTETSSKIAPQLDRYAKDASAALLPTYGAVRVVTEPVDLRSYFPTGNVDPVGHARLTFDVAMFLEERYRNGGLVGIVLIGGIPLPRVEDAGGPMLSLYPWVDFDDEAYTQDRTLQRYVRSRTKDPHPEIWSGVIREPGASLGTATLNGPVVGAPAVATLETFFTKNHLAHLGRVQMERRFLFNDVWGEQQMSQITLQNGRVPTAGELPGGTELARRDFATRFAARLISTGRYDGLNYADDALPKQLPRDQSKTLAELLKKARDDKNWNAINAWRNGSGTLKQIDVSSQVILYFDAWVLEDAPGLQRAQDAARGIVGDRHPGFDLFSRGGYDPCTETAPASGTGYFSLTEEERSAIASASGIADRKEFEFALRWSKLFTEGEKRQSLIRDGIPPFGKYRGLFNTYDVRYTVAPGDTGYVVGNARLDGICFSRGSSTNPATRGGTFEVLLGAATAKESSMLPPGGLALWTAMTGLTQAAYGSTVAPSPDIELPDDLGSLSREAVAALAAKADTPGFGRSASARGTAEGVGFDTDPFILSVLGGLPFGEAVRATMDASSVLYGDPTFHL